MSRGIIFINKNSSLFHSHCIVLTTVTLPAFLSSGTERQSGNVSYPIGVSCIIYGVAAELTYIIVLSIMARKQHRRLSCYKIMIFLGVCDMCAISVNSIFTGYLWLVGANYCMYPTLIFAVGTIGLGLWCAACMTCLILVINRLLDMWNKRVMQLLFQNNRTYLVLLFPTCYFLWFTFFTPPILFNSDHTAWFFATFAEGHDINLFYNYPHTANNLLIVVLTCLLYIQYSRVLLRHRKAGSGVLTWAQKSFFIQTSSICMANLIAALVYVYMQFFPTPSWLVMGGHICWQLGHGFPAFVYLFLNRTIQREALQMFGFRRIRTTVAHMSMPTSNKTPHTDS